MPIGFSNMDLAWNSWQLNFRRKPINEYIITNWDRDWGKKKKEQGAIWENNTIYVISTSVAPALVGWRGQSQTAVESGRRRCGSWEGRQALSSSLVETGEQWSTASRGRGGVRVETGKSGKVWKRWHPQRVWNDRQGFLGRQNMHVQWEWRARMGSEKFGVSGAWNAWGWVIEGADKKAEHLDLCLKRLNLSSDASARRWLPKLLYIKENVFYYILLDTQARSQCIILATSPFSSACQFYLLSVRLFLIFYLYCCPSWSSPFKIIQWLL